MSGNVGNLTDEQRQQALGTVQQMQEKLASLRARDFTQIDRTPSLAIPEVPREDIGAVNAMQRIEAETTEDFLARQAEERRHQLGLDTAEMDRLKEARKDLTEEHTKITEERKVEPVVRKEMADRIDPLTDLQLQSIEKARAYSHQLAQIQQDRAAALSAVSQMNISTPFLRGEQARVQEAFDRREASLAATLGAETAYTQALSGMQDQARANIGMIVNAFTYDTELELRRIEQFQQLNREEIAELDRDIVDSINETRRYWEDQLNQERTERQSVLKMMINYTQSGIQPEDSLEDAATKLAQWLNIQPDARVEDLILQYPGAGIEEGDTFAEAINKINQLPTQPDAPRVFGGAAEGRFEQYFNPQTGQWEYRQITGGLGYASSKTGTSTETGMSTTLERILAGEGSLDDLTTVQRKEIQDEAFAFGLYSEEPPEEFVNLTINALGPMSYGAVKDEWDNFRGNILQSESFVLTKERIKQAFTTEQLEAKAKESGFVTGWRKSPDVEAYLDDLEQGWELDREFGLTEEEIYKKSFK